MAHKTITDHLAQYAAYHRNFKNILTHLVGIPMIVLALITLLSRPDFVISGLSISPANILVIVAVIFYVRLDIPLGLLMALLLWICLNVGSAIAQLSTGEWLMWGIGLFVVGWVFQFIGHYFEGRKPAFVDDIMGLAIGPLFVVAEVVFMLGLRKPLKQEIDRRCS
ncbi:Uncharacterized membrane protein YGL010W [Pseudidiomarina planktonica]|uniref:Uncharacterized membrane protein YGL010W n=1 Tax=Pseudidiomarina planktonica TaxID=1323738 RepID=A0A1Y6FX15_9GAMM|nr:Mpo1-like protein [Pseudidiomarina planktonica]RUO63380.1 DUF962 domain-containing protein [Pseudidiomarina planktonica]SMQ80392.1 Uncharacterized membrane protein YGL010W [Pseudidiomarina planktonica]